MKLTTLGNTRLITFLLVSILSFGLKRAETEISTQVEKPEMVRVKGGSFMMGQTDGEGDERPIHKVLLNDFYIGKYEVTVAAYRSFCNATGRDMPKVPEWGWIDDHPIINTTWYDARDYIVWLNKTMNETYRLPTEAEFEYVMRDGGKPGVYPWGDGLPKNENLADESLKESTGRTNVWKNHNDGFAFTAPVGSYAPNALGVYDINGNIWEWCNDWYYEYSSNEADNPKGAATGDSKVGRGASYDADPWHSRTASRAYVEPTFQRPGFRLAKSID
ncbi:hypothetical protein BFP97_07085 [Roseivirga sp. 4D4]|uniref:formylglycine-generating enzyme family protein n=1 Tax=Roseivirga sp. 4D4 TaxID=1889784 RepID=UPI0008538945|nr:SUMF1/EgtB/PvdO family nonheme iron enzyme [Roseivirga sp. 4D4]OEK01291.1 hypothetical protein BFP97_07085 [Roseivirga sp. 4D4]